MTFSSVIQADLQRYIDYNEIPSYKSKSRLARIFWPLCNALIVKKHQIAWLYWFRMLQFENNTISKGIAKLMFRRISRKYGIQISPSTRIGEGLYIGHGIGIIINEKTIIGKNVNLSQFLTIGSNKGTPAIIGDNVYIGPSVCIIEDVRIGNNVKIGAGTVVINDIPDNCTSVGNPNRIIPK